MIEFNKTFSAQDQEKIERFKATVLREKGKILGTATTTRTSPDGTNVDREVTIYAEIPHVCAELDMKSYVEELDDQ